MKKAQQCVSCGKGLIERGSTTFQCPLCDEVIGRCNGCREQSIEYKCIKCEFTGP
ncbi:MAG: zinc finger domain-containing protein [Thermoplasmatota archaeon]